jgi:hypothetical protein
LKRLMAESLADLEPSDSDWPLLQHLLQAQRALFESFLSRIHSVGWFDLLAQHWIPQLLDQRDDEMLTNLAARYVLLRDSHPQKMIGFWQSLLSLDWFESRRLQSIIALELRDFRAWATPGAMDLLQLVLKSERETLASSALCRYVQETDSRDDLLWGYIITDVATLPPESHEFGSRLRCGPNDPSLPEFLLKRMAQSDALLNLVLDSIERWSVARLAASAAKAAWDELFLSATSFGRIHEANQNNYVESDKVLLGALETACLKRAETGTAWWRNNEARLRKSTDGALRYIALVAHERYPQHAGTAVAEMLRDAELLSSIRLRTEVNRLIRVAFVELNQPDQDLIQSHTLKWASEYIESEAEMLAMRRDRLAVIPTFMRTQEAQECLGLARRELGSAEGVPHTETYGGGWMVSPVSASELVALSGPSLVQLMKFLKPNNDRTQPTLESLAFDQVGSQLTLAASLDPDHFLEVLRSQTSELSLIDRAAILEGVSNHLRYRFGNVKSSAPWNPAATPNGAVLSAALLKVLHSDWHCWIRTLTAARALAACANVLDLAAEGRQFAALVSDMADAPGTQNANDNRSELLNRALNDVAGIAAEACAIVIRRLGETSAQISNSLGASFERFAAHENAPVRAMVVHQLPAIQFYFPQFGWKCFELAVEKAVFGIWQEAEHCLYYAYHDRFDLVEPYLERLRISRPPDTGDIWGRISTLCVLSGHIGLDTLLQQIEELSDPLAWKGVATVFATNAHQAQHRPLCHSGLESILKVTAAAAVVRSEMIYLFRATPAAPIPAVLLESYFETYSQDTPTQRTPLHDFQKWLVARAEFSAQEALDAIAIAIRKYINPPPYAWDVELYPTVLTRLFREGEDVESIDNGAFLKRVIRVQDELIRVSDQRIDHWLAEAERS